MEKKTTLKTFLELLENKAINIKICAKDGSSFFYIGTAEDFLENSEKYEAIDIAYFDNRVNSANDSLELLLNTDTSFSAYAQKQYSQWEGNSTRPNFNIKAYEQWLVTHSNRLLVKFNSLIKERKIRLDRIKLLKREVVENFVADATIEPTETIVICIPGHEKGAFWTMSEADGPTMLFSGNNPYNEKAWDEEEE